MGSSAENMTLPGATDQAKLDALSAKTYKEQAIWFLNGFWHKLENQAEPVWNYVQRMGELDAENHENGCQLDEMMAHRFLETFDETMTVRAMRETLRDVGIEKVRHVPLCHYLICRYKVDWHLLVNASQGDNQAEVEEAQRKLKQVQKAVEEAQAAAKVSAAREADAKKAKQELEAALAELKSQEDAYNNKTAELTKKSEQGGVVQKNKAKAELAQHLAEDPLPLRRAKINQEAAVRKAERAAAEAETARVAAETALDEAQKQLAEAEAYLEEVRSKPGSAAGALWWIDRELHEQKKYLPTSRGGISKK